MYAQLKQHFEEIEIYNYRTCDRCLKLKSLHDQVMYTWSMYYQYLILVLNKIAHKNKNTKCYFINQWKFLPQNKLCIYKTALCWIHSPKAKSELCKLLYIVCKLLCREIWVLYIWYILYYSFKFKDYADNGTGMKGTCWTPAFPSHDCWGSTKHQDRNCFISSSLNCLAHETRFDWLLPGPEHLEGNNIDSHVWDPIWNTTYLKP